MRKRLTILLLQALCVSFLACSRERATHVKLGTGLSFTLSGSGRLASFTVYAPRPGEHIAFPHPDVASVVWQIKPSGNYFSGTHVEGLRMVYGSVPNGYSQVVPKQSEKAVSLATGSVYSFFAETTDAPAADGFFYMGPRGPVMTSVPDLCLKLESGHEVRVKCGTSEPYEEPNDLPSLISRNSPDK